VELPPACDDSCPSAPAREAAGGTAPAPVEQLRQAGFTRLRLPTEYGGYGLSLPQAYEFFVALAAADSNLAQALRAHWGFVEDVLSRTDDQETFKNRRPARLGAGVIVRKATTEPGHVQGETSTR